MQVFLGEMNWLRMSWCLMNSLLHKSIKLLKPWNPMQMIKKKTSALWCQHCCSLTPLRCMSCHFCSFWKTFKRTPLWSRHDFSYVIVNKNEGDSLRGPVRRCSWPADLWSLKDSCWEKQPDRRHHIRRRSRGTTSDSAATSCDANASPSEPPHPPPPHLPRLLFTPEWDVTLNRVYITRG